MTRIKAAALRLKAWKAVEGWCTDGVPWGWEKRQRHAAELFAWMCGEPNAAVEPENPTEELRCRVDGAKACVNACGFICQRIGK
jgi:hypothetical protein